VKNKKIKKLCDKDNAGNDDDVENTANMLVVEEMLAEVKVVMIMLLVVME